MNKKLLASLMMMGLLVGCGGNTSSLATSSQTPTTSSKTEVSSEVSSATHEHTYATEWSKDADKHWHAATCEHDTLKADEAEHTWDAGTTTGTATCTEAGEITYTCTVCGYEKTEATNALNHNYGAPTYAWADDNSTVTATMVCANDATHVVTETVTATAVVTQNQSCTDVELTTYTATFTNEAFETQTKADVQTKDALTHSYGAPTYEWSDDNSIVTATMVCAHDATHVVTETTITSSTVTQEATHELDELSTYTATFENSVFETQTKANVVTKEAVTECVYERYATSETQHFKQCLYCENKLEGEDHSCTTKEAWAQGRTCDVCEYAMAAEHAMLAEFTFEDGIKNTGVDSSIRGTGLSNATDTRYTEIDTTANIFNSHTQGSTTYDMGTKAVKAGHASNYDYFGVQGIDTGTGDFTISLKTYTPYDFMKQSDTKVDGVVTKTAAEKFDEKNWQWYLCGTAYEDSRNRPDSPCFDIRLGKESNGAGWFIPKVRINGEEKALYDEGNAGYWQARKWVEFRIVKEGTTVTVSTAFDAYGTAKGKPYSVTFELESSEDFMITPDQVLGVGCNYNVTRPGAYSYFDDIKVWNYAVDFAA